MKHNRKYDEMIVYMDSNSSGSFFNAYNYDLLNLYAMSASGPMEASYATYCSSPFNVVKGKSLNTCLGDLFSTNWLEDSDEAKMKTETF